MTERAFSVVVCTDGRLPALKATLQSLDALEYRRFELCLVCGPTPDGTRAFAQTLGHAKIAHCPERNLSQARNLGIALAAGEIVAFLDDDAIPEPEWLADLNRAYDDAPQVAAAGGVVYDATGLTFQTRFVTIDRLGYPHTHWSGPAERLNYPYSPEFPHLLGANCSFRRDILIELGGFDEEYEYFLDETDLIARLNDFGGAIAQLPGAAVHHRPAASALRSAQGVARHWRPLLKNRVYFGLRNGALHHGVGEVLRATAEDAEGWRRCVERDGSPADVERLEEETRDGVAAGLLAAGRPRRLMREAARRAAPPPLLPYPVAVGDRLCLALVSQDYPPGANGGIARNVEALAREWARLGHHVHVFTRARGAPSLDFEDGVWVHRAAVANGGPPPELGEHAIPQGIWDYSRAMFEEVARLDARRRVDFVYAPLWDAEPVAFLHDPRFPLVCALQTTMDFWLDSQPALRRDPEWMAARGAPLLALERWILARAPRLHANSRAIVEDIAQRYRLSFDAQRIVYAPHGLPDWAQARHPHESGLPWVPASAGTTEAIRFLFVGRLESRKGIDTLLAAAPGVLRRFPQARLDIVGDDTIARPEGGTYRAAFAASPEIAARVHFHGRVDEAGLRAHYRDCDVLVAPSRYESFGLVFVEGMMFAKPVIAGRAGGAREVIADGETGLLAAPGDADALAEAMTRLAQNPALRRAMGEAGRRRYEARYRVDAAAKALLDGLTAAAPGLRGEG